MTCPVCSHRKPKRACPALGKHICTVCCGTKRIVEIACPADCGYLGSAQRHPATVVRRQHEHDVRTLMTAVGRPSESQLQVFLLIQTVIARFDAGRSAPIPTVSAGMSGHPQLIDADVAEAVGALASTFETAGRGVLYEHQATSPAAEALRREVKRVLQRVGQAAGARFEREAADVLRAVERAARHEIAGMGAGEQDYLGLVARVLKGRLPDVPSATSIIVP